MRPRDEMTALKNIQPHQKYDAMWDLKLVPTAYKPVSSAQK